MYQENENGYQNQNAYQSQNGYQSQNSCQGQTGYQSQSGQQTYYQTQGGQQDYAQSGSQQSFGQAGNRKSHRREQSGKRGGHGIGKKVLGLTLSALLFGTVAAGAFVGVSYGAGKLLPAGTSESQDVQGTEDNGAGTNAAQDANTVNAAANGQNASGSVALSTVSDDGKDNSQSLDVSDVAAGVMPSMVSITNVSVQEVQSYLSLFGMGQPLEREVESTGSGIIIGQNDSELLIVTNNHVVEGAQTLSVCFAENSVVSAVVKGTDPDNDLAVVAVKLEDISKDTMSQIKIAQIGNSDELIVGQQVVAIGNALGYGQSVTTGIISALNRQIDSTDAALIQTDAAINPGNSGGALLNMKGEVIGINSAKFASTEVEGMGYAISITAVSPIIENLMNRQTREQVAEEDASWIGITGQDVSEAVEGAYGIPVGVYVTSVEADSPAEAAGLAVGNVIVSFDGQTVKNMDELKGRLAYYAAGETVPITVKVWSDGEYTEKELTLTLGSQAEYQERQEETQSEQAPVQGGGHIRTYPFN